MSKKRIQIRGNDSSEFHAELTEKHGKNINFVVIHTLIAGNGSPPAPACLPASGWLQAGGD